MANKNGSSGAAAPISAGTVWMIGWLFTLGYAHLSFGKGVLALLLWPYYLGAAVSAGM